MIKEYIEAKYGFKVHTAYIAEVKQSISEGAMTALGISKRQEFYNQERQYWRGADAVFYI